jgi:hypothetical protein
MFKHGHDTRRTLTFSLSAKQLQIIDMGNLSDHVDILMHL